MRTDPRLNKWCKWLRIIEDDVGRLLSYRQIFSEVKTIAEQNNKLDLSHPYFSFFVITYMDSAVMGIRRQAKPHRDSISLAGLLDEIVKNPQLITRSDHYELYRNNDRYPQTMLDRMRAQTFNEFASPESKIIDAVRVGNDIQTLEEICKNVEDFADRRIAHWDEKEPLVDLNLEMIFQALEKLESLIERYHLLFFAETKWITPGLPSPVSDLFTEPWIVS